MLFIALWVGSNWVGSYTSQLQIYSTQSTNHRRSHFHTSCSVGHTGNRFHCNCMQISRALGLPFSPSTLLPQSPFLISCYYYYYYYYYYYIIIIVPTVPLNSNQPTKRSASHRRNVAEARSHSKLPTMACTDRRRRSYSRGMRATLRGHNRHPSCFFRDRSTDAERQRDAPAVLVALCSCQHRQPDRQRSGSCVRRQRRK